MTRAEWTQWLSAACRDMRMDVRRLRVRTLAIGEIEVPVAPAWTFGTPASWKGSPRPWSVNRRLLNSFLGALRGTGLFDGGQWVDVGGTREYGDSLGVPADRYHTFNLPSVAGAGIGGDICGSIPDALVARFDGLVCLNSFFLFPDTRRALGNMMRMLRPSSPFVIGCNVAHNWYRGGDGDAHVSFNPFLICTLIRGEAADFVLFPIGNMFQAALDYYARRPPFDRRPLRGLVRLGALWLGRFDRGMDAPMQYVVIGVKRGAESAVPSVQPAEAGR